MRVFRFVAAIAVLAFCFEVQAQSDGLHDRPTLVLDPGVHTAPISRADVDAAGKIAVTGSQDKTVRLWSIADGRLRRTIRVPAGPGYVGRINALAISPDGKIVAAGGWTRWTDGDQQDQIYLFDTATGGLIQRIAGLPSVVKHLAFSPDGRRLVATIGYSGIRLYRRDGDWQEVARDTNYGGESYGAAFNAGGRLATTSYDGKLRLYDADGDLIHSVATGQERPFTVAFSPDKLQIAVGFSDTPLVKLYDSRTLQPLPAPDVVGITNGDISEVAWSTDGNTLYAGGQYGVNGISPVVAWDKSGHGARRTLPAGSNTLMSLRPLPDGTLFVASTDPWLGLLTADGTARWTRTPVQMDPRGQRHNLAVSADGTVVDFGFAEWGKERVRLDVSALSLMHNPASDGRTAPPNQKDLPVENWINNTAPTLDGKALPLNSYETSRSLAIHPDGDRFVLGTEWSLRAFDSAGTQLWHRAVPGIVWAVNISGDGRYVVAAYGDGTIRWHDMADGTERLAFFAFNDGSNRWVLWTPDGYHAGPPEADGVLGWSINRGWDQAAKFVPVAEQKGFYRPEVIKLVLRTGNVDRALERAQIVAPRPIVPNRDKKAPALGARLHVLSVGVSRYELHERLSLEYADNDASDLTTALLKQSTLYDKVNLEGPLVDDLATRRRILAGLRKLEQRMRPDAEDVAVIHFSGHGEKVFGRYYLLPHDVDASSEGGIEDTGVSIDEVITRVRRIGRKGKVLVLLDACHSGAVVEGSKGALPPDIADVRKALAEAGPGVVVLSSSKGRQISKEDADWENGAFTEAVLEALAGKADGNGDEWISIGELQSYVVGRVQTLTNYAQTPTITVPGEKSYEARLFRVPR